MRCPKCGFGNSKSATECKECGAPLTPEAQPQRQPARHPPEWRPYDGPVSTKEYAENILADLRSKLKHEQPREPGEEG